MNRITNINIVNSAGPIARSAGQAPYEQINSDLAFRGNSTSTLAFDIDNKIVSAYTLIQINPFLPVFNIMQQIV
jgi:hypothetical protein